MVLAEKATGTRSMGLGEGVRGHHQESRSAQQGDSAWSRGPGGQRALHSALPHSGSEGYQQRRPRNREGPARSPHGALPALRADPVFSQAAPACYRHGELLRVALLVLRLQDTYTMWVRAAAFHAHK